MSEALQASSECPTEWLLQIRRAVHWSCAEHHQQKGAFPSHHSLTNQSNNSPAHGSLGVVEMMRSLVSMTYSRSCKHKRRPTSTAATTCWQVTLLARIIQLMQHREKLGYPPQSAHALSAPSRGQWAGSPPQTPAAHLCSMLDTQWRMDHFTLVRLRLLK